MRLRTIVGQPGNSSSISRVKLRQTTDQLGKRAGFYDVGHRLGLTKGAQVFLQAPQCPWLARKRFRRDHCCYGRVKPGCRIVGSSTRSRWALTTGADFQDSRHWLLISVGVMTHHKSFLDVRRCCRIWRWIGQRSCERTFVTSLSVTAFLRRAGGSMLVKTVNQESGVKRRVPEMSRMVEFSCTLTRLVLAEWDQTGAQYSAAK